MLGTGALDDRAPVMASHALIPAVTALPAATSQRPASRLSTAVRATPSIWTSRRGSQPGRPHDG